MKWPRYPQGQGGVAFLPYVPVLLKSLKKLESWRTPSTLGEHILRARMERGLNQHELAALLGVSFATVLHWEKNQTEPRIKDMPSILQFLGYDPFAGTTDSK